MLQLAYDPVPELPEFVPLLAPPEVDPVTTAVRAVSMLPVALSSRAAAVNPYYAPANLYDDPAVLHFPLHTECPHMRTCLRLFLATVCPACLLFQKEIFDDQAKHVQSPSIDIAQ